jgi:hypothetical protein
MAKFDRRDIGYVAQPEDLVISNFSGWGNKIGVYAEGVDGLTVRDSELGGADVPLIAKDVANFRAVNNTIRGKLLEELYGDFEFLKVKSIDEIVAVGRLLASKPKKTWVHHLRRNPLILDAKPLSRGELMGLAGLLVSIASLFL